MSLSISPRYLLPCLLLVVALPSVFSLSCYRGAFLGSSSCIWYDNYCCYLTAGGSSSCCSYLAYSYTNKLRTSQTSCYNGFSYSKCFWSTDTRCCRWTVGGSSSCCNYLSYSYTSSKSFYGTSTVSTSIGAIVGGVIGGIIFLILIIVIPIVICGACAASSSHRTGTTVVRTTAVHPVNQGYRGPPPQTHPYGNQPPPPGQPQNYPPQSYPPPSYPPPAYGQYPPANGNVPPPAVYPPPPGPPPAMPHPNQNTNTN